MIGEIRRSEKGYVRDVDGRITWQKNCVANMPEDIKRKIVDHANIAITSPDGAMPEELFTFASEGHNNSLCESVTYGSGKQGKLKSGWEEEFAW